jgi:hypothetical protein
MTNLSPKARAWLRAGGPNLGGIGYPLGGPWAMVAGRVCDFARVPVRLGVQMLALSRSVELKADHPLGPAFIDHATHAAAFALALGTAKVLPDVLMCAQDVPENTVSIVRKGTIIRVPAPLGVCGSGLEWLQEPADEPFLPRQGTFAFLVGRAARDLAESARSS